MPFSEWVVSNREVFTSPYDSSGRGEFFPHYCVRHPIPENLKSQYTYLRPDLGTDIYPFEEIEQLAGRLGVTLPRENATSPDPSPELSLGAKEHIGRWFAWDYHERRRRGYE